MTSTTEARYIAAYCDVIRCVSHCERYVTNSLASLLEDLERHMTPAQVEACKNAARRKMDYGA